MKKLGLVIAAIGTLAVALPSIASAETMMVKRGDHHWDRAYGARAEMRHDRDRHDGWRHHHHDRMDRHHHH